MVAIDIETFDPELSENGRPGVMVGRGELLCVGYYRDEDFNGVLWYDKDNLAIKDLLELNEQKIFHNASYDLLWLKKYGFNIYGGVHDTLLMASLVDSDVKHNSLEACAVRYSVGVKNAGDTIEQWWNDHKPLKDKRSHYEAIKHIPRDIVNQYCLNDCILTRKLYDILSARVTSMDLTNIYNIERRLLKPTLRMHMNGMRIDTAGLKKVTDDWEFDLGGLEEEIMYKAGINNARSSKDIALYFMGQGVKSTITTATGGESWDKLALKSVNDPVADMIIKARSMSQVYSTFLVGSLGHLYNGRIYGQFHQSGRDEGGTITGRYSSSKPNLQNIPSSDDKGGKQIRALFLPDEGCELGAFDYKQVEFRLFSHYAIKYRVSGWEELSKAMQEGRDYHLFVQNIVKWVREEDPAFTKRMRKVTKTMNFGILYGMGRKKCYINNKDIFVPEPGQDVMNYVDWLYEEYHRKLPFVKETIRKIDTAATTAGFLVDIAGRRHKTELDKVYKSTNKLIQGGAAGILKRAMVEADARGIWDKFPLHLTVHDELVFSMPDTKDKEDIKQELKECMVKAVDLTVPLDVDCEVGPNWAEVH